MTNVFSFLSLLYIYINLPSINESDFSLLLSVSETSVSVHYVNHYVNHRSSSSDSSSSLSDLLSDSDSESDSSSSSSPKKKTKTKTSITEMKKRKFTLGCNSHYTHGQFKRIGSTNEKMLLECMSFMLFSLQRLRERLYSTLCYLPTWLWNVTFEWKQ